MSTTKILMSSLAGYLEAPLVLKSDVRFHDFFAAFDVPD